MKYVSCMGGVWKLTDKRYKDMLSEGSRGGEIDLDEYGKYMGSLWFDITDATPDEFAIRQD